jgi:hypothetical protein
MQSTDLYKNAAIAFCQFFLQEKGAKKFSEQLNVQVRIPPLVSLHHKNKGTNKDNLMSDKHTC